MKKDSMYDRVEAWMVANLRSATEVIEYDEDKSTLNMGSLGKLHLSDKKVLNSTAKPAIAYEDKGQGSIVGNGLMNYPCASGCFATGDWRLLYTMKVDLKDEKFRITFSNPMIAWPYDKNDGHPIDVNLGIPPRNQSQMADIKKGLLTLAGTLNSSLDKKANSNW